VAGGFDLLLLLVDAAYAHEKAQILNAANREINRLRYLLRASHQLRLLPHDSYQFAAEKLDEIGRMVGGWRRMVEAKK